MRAFFHITLFLSLLLGTQAHAGVKATVLAAPVASDEKHADYSTDSSAIDFTVIADTNFDVEDSLTAESDHVQTQKAALGLLCFIQAFQVMFADSRQVLPHFEAQPIIAHLPIYLSNRVLRI